MALKTKSEYAFLGKTFIFKKNKIKYLPGKFILNKEYSNDESGIYVNELLSFLIRIMLLHILFGAAFTTRNGKWTEKLTSSKL